MDARALETATRRLVATQFVLMTGDPEHQEQVRAFTDGKLGDEETPKVAADLDRIAVMLTMLIPG